MESISLATLLEITRALGPWGIIVVIWWIDQRNMWRLVEDRRKETQAILNGYREDMDEVREMYKNNVKLVEFYQSLAQDLHDIVVLNVQKLSSMEKAIETNQFCPLSRLRRDVEVQ